MAAPDQAIAAVEQVGEPSAEILKDDFIRAVIRHVRRTDSYDRMDVGGDDLVEFDKLLCQVAGLVGEPVPEKTEPVSYSLPADPNDTSTPPWLKRTKRGERDDQVRPELLAAEER
jgi:hypothetical protein